MWRSCLPLLQHWTSSPHPKSPEAASWPGGSREGGGCPGEAAQRKGRPVLPASSRESQGLGLFVGSEVAAVRLMDGACAHMLCLSPEPRGQGPAIQVIVPIPRSVLQRVPESQGNENRKRLQKKASWRLLSLHGASKLFSSMNPRPWRC